MNLSKDKFKKLMDEIMDHYKTVSLSDLDVLKLVKHKAKSLLYKDLEKYNSIDEALGKHGALFLLYETSLDIGVLFLEEIRIRLTFLIVTELFLTRNFIGLIKIPENI